MTFDAIGAELGITGEAARKIYARALIKLKIAMGIAVIKKSNSNQVIWSRNWQAKNREKYLTYKREYNRTHRKKAA